MAIKKYFATKDNTITNAYEANLTTRATGSSMGASDILEVFSIYGQESSGSSELSRVLIQFPVSGTDVGEIKGDRTAGTIPASGSVNFYLRMFNAKHGQTIPRDFLLNIHAISQSWSEGIGLDMDDYSDITKDIEGSNWIKATGSTSWGQIGGTFHTGVAYTAGETMPMYSASFEGGTEDLIFDVTSMVEEWIAGTHQNYGFAVYLTASNEAYYSSSTGADESEVPHNTEGALRSYYTKRFFARGSQFFYKRPVLEARWDSSRLDDRGNFYLSSSIASAEDNLNTIFLYNNIRGQLKDIPGLDTTGDKIIVSIFSGTDDPTGDRITLPIGGGVATNDDFHVTGSRIDTGVYSASFAYTSSAITTIFPVWHSGASEGSNQYHTGSGIAVKTLNSLDYNPNTKYVTNIKNMKPRYNPNEVATFRLFVREKDWKPNIYTVASSDVETTTIDKAYYKVVRTFDDLEVIGYGTGSDNHTLMSHDVSGNYFDLDMSMLQDNYMYTLKVAYYINDAYREQPEKFNFRVEKDN